MKTLNYIGEIFQAKKIVKGDNYITGYDENDIVLFEFKEIVNFTPFTLNEREEWDLPDVPPEQPKIINDLVTGGANDALSAEQGKIIKDYYDQIAGDVQTLFTGWANETQNAVTALAQKGVTLSQDATMKEIVTGIENIQSGGQSKTLSVNSTNAPKTFKYVGSANNVSLSYVTINIDDIGFDPVAIFVEDNTFGGNATSVKTDSETFLSARLVDFDINTRVGTNKWLELGTNGFPSSGNMDIPVSNLGAYTVTIYG